MTNFTVIGGPASQTLAKNLANKLDANYIKTNVRIFPDGENKVTVGGKPTGKTIIVQSTYPPVDSNFIQALSLVSKARETSSQVIAVIPYLCYMRQDKEFLPGEVVTSTVIAKMLKAVGASKIATADMHSTLSIKYFDVSYRYIKVFDCQFAVYVHGNYFIHPYGLEHFCNYSTCDNLSWKKFFVLPHITQIWDYRKHLR